jgi:hypothetical protein
LRRQIEKAAWETRITGLVSANILGNALRIHAGTGSNTNSSVCRKNASLDNLTASAIASFVLL